jgi:hypothetical protein
MRIRGGSDSGRDVRGGLSVEVFRIDWKRLETKGIQATSNAANKQESSTYLNCLATHHHSPCVLHAGPWAALFSGLVSCFSF